MASTIFRYPWLYNNVNFEGNNLATSTRANSIILKAFIKIR